MTVIERLRAREILDSRGRPTVRATCDLAGGARASAAVPSGASTGRGEALELRDGDPARYAGLGCQKAVGLIDGLVNNELRGRAFDQESLDEALIALDGTKNRSRLGANSTLAVSLSFARAVAAERALPLYRHLALDEADLTLPRLTVNLLSGGKHAGEQVSIQDVLVVPVSPESIDESLVMTSRIYLAAADLIRARYGMRLLRADEGGLAPPCQSSEAMLRDAVEAIAAAGYEPGRDCALAVDVAASHFFRDGVYHFDGATMDGAGMVALLTRWIEEYPIISLEDGLAEADWEHWPLLKYGIAGRALVMGDDLLCTNPALIARAAETAAADALLLKVNQIGTLTEARQALLLARAHGWRVTVSARSGETEDDWLADLAVGWAADYIKVGSITQSERLAKYNRLLAIEIDEGFPLARLARPS